MSLIYAVRTVIFYLILSIWTIFWSSFMLILLPFFPLKRKHVLVKIWGLVVMFFCRFVVGIKWRLHGVENIPTQPCVIVSNHQSTWETFFFQTLFTPQTQVIKKSILKIPFYGWAFSLLKPIAIDRKDPKGALKQLTKQGLWALNNDIWVLVFPEGTRMKSGELGKFSKGAANLACKANRNVLPIAHSANICWPMTTWIKYPGVIDMHIGQEVLVQDKTPIEVNNEVRSTIETSLQLIKNS